MVIELASYPGPFSDSSNGPGYKAMIEHGQTID